MTVVNKKQVSVVLMVLILLVSVCFSDLLTIEDVKRNKLWISDFIDNNYLFSVFLFFLSCVVFINSPVPFAAIVKLLGGFFFGFYMGAVYNIVATILACLVGFGISRYAFKEVFEKTYFERLKTVEAEIENNGFYYFLMLRLVMVVPYFFINIIAGVSRISFKNYAFSTVLGVIPASLVYANGGNKLEQINSVSELFRSDVVASLLLVSSVSLLPVFMKNRHRLVRRQARRDGRLS